MILNNDLAAQLKVVHTVVCATCGRDSNALAIKDLRDFQEKMMYRRALYAACGGDKELVQKLLDEAVK